MPGIRRTVLLAILLLAAFASWYLQRQTDAPTDASAPVVPAVQGYYLRSARIFGTGPDGQLIYEILASYAEQRPDESVQFEEVNIRYVDGSGVPWSVSADRAIVDARLPVIRLEGQVRATSADGIGGDETEIRTEQLQLDPERSTATSDARVQIRIGSRSLTATGLFASLDENRLELKSNVSGRFTP